MKYLSSLTKIEGDLYRVDGIHHMPFDEKYGLGKSVEELEKTGVLVSELPPTPAIEEGFQYVLVYDMKSGSLYYEKQSSPNNFDQEIARLKADNETLKNLVADLTEVVLMGV